MYVRNEEMRNKRVIVNMYTQVLDVFPRRQCQTGTVVLAKVLSGKI